MPVRGEINMAINMSRSKVLRFGVLEGYGLMRLRLNEGKLEKMKNSTIQDQLFRQMVRGSSR